MSNNQVVENKNYADILNALNEQFATNVNRIYIHSLDREVGFREIKVAEQKTLAKIFIDNENRPDIIYDSQVALIENLCLEKDSVNFKELTELDRIKIMIELYQSNFFKNSTSFKCKECGTENKYEIDFENLIQKINNEKFEDINYKKKSNERIFEIILGFPTINKLSKFHKLVYLSSRNKISKKIEISDMIDMFIKNINIINKDGSNINIDSDKLSIEEFESILEKLPIDIIYNEDGVIGEINRSFFKRIEKLFDKPKCKECGYEEDGEISISDFFI
jgi:hypothetical protein